MTITLPTLDAEQVAASAQLTAEYNASAQTSLSESEYLALVILGTLNARKVQNIDARGAALIAAAKALPDDKRLQFTEQTEQAYATIAAQIP